MNFKKTGTIVFSVAIFFSTSCNKKEKSENKGTSLKEAYSGLFLIGTALNNNQIFGRDLASTSIAEKHFNAVTAENDMKWERVHPQPNQYDFGAADKLVEFGAKNNMFIIGHTLIWHSQTPDWVFEDENGNLASRDTLLERMKEHIYTVVGRYKNKVHGWDVINEAVNSDGTLRQSKWMQIIGKDYIRKAFEFAHEADTSAELYYNDYSMTTELKRKRVVQLVNNLNNNGTQIDGIGMQAHFGMNYFNIDEFEKSIIEYATTGAQVMLTELDISVLPFPSAGQSAEVSLKFEFQEELNPFSEGLPDSVEAGLIKTYTDIFSICKKHHEKISRITLWGINDGQSWKNHWPVPGRTDYPLLFDRNNKPKKVVKALIQIAEN